MIPMVKTFFVLTLGSCLVFGIFTNLLQKNNLDNQETKFEDNLKDKMNLLCPKEPVDYELSFFNNRPGATGEEDSDWVSAKSHRSTDNPGPIVAFVNKYGFDKEFIQSLSNGGIMKSNNAKDAEGFCGGQGYKLFKFQNFQPNTKLDWKEEMERFMEWFYPALSMGKNGKVLVNLDGDETGRISPRVECISLVYLRLLEFEKVVGKIDLNSTMLHVAKGHFFNCCKM